MPNNYPSTVPQTSYYYLVRGGFAKAKGTDSEKREIGDDGSYEVGRSLAIVAKVLQGDIFAPPRR